jgi:succinoglycan biosynthesis transport protein ExoP
VPSANTISTKLPHIGAEFSPLSLLRAVWKHKLLASTIASLVTVAGVMVAYRLPAVYQAEALILVDPQKIPEKFVSSTVNIDVQDRLAAISQEIQSSTRLQKIVDEFNLYSKERPAHSPEELVALMRKDIQTTLERGVGGNRPGAFRITYQGSDPNVVVKVVDRIVQFYIDENHRSRALQAQGTYSFMESQLQEAKKGLEEQELALSQYKLRHTGELPQQEVSLNAVLSRLEMQLQGNQDATNRAQQNRIIIENTLSSAEALESTLNQQAKKIATDRAAGSDPGVDSVPPPIQTRPHRPSDDIEAQISALQMRYSDQYPEVRRQRAILAEMRRHEREEDAKAKPSAPYTAASGKVSTPSAPEEPLVVERAHAQERVASLKAQLAASNSEFQTRATEREHILREMSTYQRRIEELPVRDLEMASLTRNHEFSRNYYNSVLSKKTEAEMATELEERQKAETFRILDRPHVPTKPVKPKREVLSALSATFGLVLGLVVAVGRELKAGVLLGEWELPAGMTILGRVPRIEPTMASAVDDHDKPVSGKREPLGPFQRFANLSSSFLMVLATKMTCYFSSDQA